MGPTEGLALLGEKGTSLCSAREGLWLLDFGFSSDGFGFSQNRRGGHLRVRDGCCVKRGQK